MSLKTKKHSKNLRVQILSKIYYFEDYHHHTSYNSILPIYLICTLYCAAFVSFVSWSKSGENKHLFVGANEILTKETCDRSRTKQTCCIFFSISCICIFYFCNCRTCICNSCTCTCTCIYICISGMKFSQGGAVTAGGQNKQNFSNA